MSTEKKERGPDYYAKLDAARAWLLADDGSGRLMLHAAGAAIVVGWVTAVHGPGEYVSPENGLPVDGAVVELLDGGPAPHSFNLEPGDEQARFIPIVGRQATQYVDMVADLQEVLRRHVERGAASNTSPPAVALLLRAALGQAQRQLAAAYEAARQESAVETIGQLEAAKEGT